METFFCSWCECVVEEVDENGMCKDCVEETEREYYGYIDECQRYN